MLIDVIPSVRMHDTAMLYQPKYIKPMNYGMGITHTMLAKDGRRIRGMIEAYVTQELYVSESRHIFSDLATS